MDIRVLGGVGLGDGSRSLGPRDRVVLGALVVRRGEVVSADALADALWSERPPSSWAKVVQGCIVRLRRALGPEAIETQGRGYRLRSPAEEVDAVRFERLVGRARELLVLGEPDRAAYTVDEALQLWAGDPWPELEAWEPARIEADRLREIRLSAEELRLDAALQSGRVEEVLAEVRSRVSEAPLREHRWASWALALYQAGRQGDALEALRRARRVLSEELGVDPGPELVSMEQAILRQDESLRASTTPVGTSVCPYQGLVPYDVEDAEHFFGRGRQIQEGLDRVEASGVLAVVGPSGSGKSSLVRAGVAAALCRLGRDVVIITPGTHPLDALAAATGSTGEPVLVVDQCEEVVTLCDDEVERAEFLQAVAERADRSPVVLALRADKLGEFTPYPEFVRLLERGFYLLAGMDPTGLREAIESPARQAGLLFEPGLVDLLVREVEGEPGSLPLLSHALEQTWARREGSTLTVEGYQATGGIRGAVAQTADAVYAQVPAGEHRVLRDLLLRLVTPTPEGEPVRSRVPRRSVATDEAHERMIETLVRARLVTSDDGVVEIAHESLARAWPRLREWLVDDVEGQRIWRHLTTSAEAWDAMGRPPSELYRGVRLARAREWRERSGDDLNDAERDFLEASETAYRSEQDREQQEAARQVRVNRRLRALVAGVASLALVAVLVGAVAFRQADRADAQAAEARAQAGQARAHELSASAVGAIGQSPGLAKLLAVSAAMTAPMTVETSRVLHQVWAADDTVARHTHPVEVDGGLSLHPDGTLLAMSGVWFDQGARSLQVVDPLTGDDVWSYELPSDPGHDAAYVMVPNFSPDGQLLAGGIVWEPHQGGRPGWVREEGQGAPEDLLGGYLWDAATGEVVERVDLGPCGGVVMQVTEATLLARARTDGADNGCAEFYEDETGGADVILVDRETGKRTTLPAGPAVWGVVATLSADGRTVAYAEPEPSAVVVMDVETGEELMRAETRTPELWAFAEDASFVVVSIEPMEVWDVGSGELVATYNGHDAVVNHASLVPGTETIVSSGNDGSLHQWEARTGREVEVYPGAGNKSATASGNGLLAVVRDDGGVQVVDTTLRGELAEMPTCPAFVFSDSLNASVEKDLVTLGLACDDAKNSTTLAYRPSTGEQIFSLSGHQGQVTSISPDGTRWFRQDGTGVARPGEPPATVDRAVLRDSRAGDVLVVLEGTCSYLVNTDYSACAEFPETPFDLWAWEVAWSPDGKLLAATVQSEAFAPASGVAVWDATTGDLVHAGPVLEEHDFDDVARDLIFTPDGTGLLVSLEDGQVLRLDTTTWAVQASGRLTTDRAGVLGFAAQGDLIAMGRYRAQDLGATLEWMDPVTLEVTRTVRDVHDGSVRAGSIDPGGTRLATASWDGTVRVWDLGTGVLAHEVAFEESQPQATAWVGEHDVAVAFATGDAVVVTVDPEELLQLVRSSLTRGYTQTECETYGFDRDCPVLAEMRGLRPGGTDPAGLTGTYALSWTTEELQGAFVDGVGSTLAVDQDEVAAEEVLARAEEMAGDYTLTLEGPRYELRRDGQVEPDCVGSVEVDDAVLRLGAERGARCAAYTLLEAPFRLEEDRLHLQADGFVGPWWERLTWTTRPLERVEG
ncbi:BTAD domain-containing putative transcriptional regulator [Ornithinimicrobium sp. W1679]|uniref:nSTAND1 domain-containing NTPase n=1 Tax=Ornithinimicrobium sp. W1679 TaxID=3418770 RepID=UPI003CFA82CF